MRGTRAGRDRCGGGVVWSAAGAGARPRAALVLVLCVLAVVSCRDTLPNRRSSGEARSSLQIDPPPPVEPVCPSPGDGPDPRPAALSPSPSVAAGALRGSFSVASGGESTYAIPLPVLPGRAGIEPSLSITYDSSAGEGPLGVGFTLSGLSTISRCPRNVAQDDEIAPVRDDETDALCMDGKRLVPVDEDPAQPGQAREYRTFPDTLTRVTADFAEGDGWDADRGPKSLTAYTRSGLILEYGSMARGRVLARQGVVRSWLLTRMRDRSGNRLEIFYKNDRDPAEGYTVEHAPLRIDYTAHELAPASRAVEFDYSDLEGPDVRYLYARGMRLRRSLQLDAIRMLGPHDALAREVRLTYGQAPATGRRLLQQIQECDAAGVCRPPTRFTWHGGGTPQFTELPTTIEDPESAHASLMLLDVTGDGLDDLLIPDIDMTGGSENKQTNWRLAPNRSQEIAPSFFASAAVAYQEPHNTAEGPPYQPEHGTPIDYNHDGRVDVLLHDVHGYHGTWKVLLANANETFSWLDTGVAHHFPGGAKAPGLRSPLASAHLADVTGDGMQDLIQCWHDGNQEVWTLHRWTPDGPGFEPVGTSIAALYQYPCHAEIHPLDIDADGRVELVVQHITVTSGGPLPGSKYDALAYEIRDGTWTRADTELPIVPAGGRLLFLDVNGDGLPDAIWARPMANEPIDTWINTGDGFILGGSSVEGAFPATSFFVRLAATIDFNADGRQDLLLPMQEPGGIPDWVVLQSTGSVGAGTFTLVDPGLPFQAQLLQDEAITLADARAPRVTDVDGDGIQDVLLLISGYVKVFKNSLHHEDLLASVTDGLNAHDPGHPRFLPNVQISYDQLIDRATTTGTPQDSLAAEQRTYLLRDPSLSAECAYPVRCVVGPRRVVSGYVLNNGADQPRRFQVAYRNGRYHRLGRGWLGFGARIVRDLDTGAGSADFYDNTTYDGILRVFPYAGQIEEAWRWSPTIPRAPKTKAIAYELQFTSFVPSTHPTQGASYFTLPMVRHEVRRQAEHTPGGAQTVEQFVRAAKVSPEPAMSRSWQIVTDIDAYGNVLGEWTTTEGVDLEMLVHREYQNDEDDWILGRMTRMTECSTAAGVEPCRVTERSYDDAGRVVRENKHAEPDDPDTQLTVRFRYDDFGNITLTSAEEGHGGRRDACTSYDAEGIYPYAHRNAAGHLSYTRYDPVLGVLQAAVDPNGLATRWKHDRFGQVTGEITPDGVVTTVTRTRTPDGGAYQDEWNVKVRVQTPGLRDDTTQLDSLGREVRWWRQAVQVGAGPLPRVMEEIAFGPGGDRVVRRSRPAPDPAPPNTVQHNDQYEYDGVGRVVRHVSPWLAETTYQYLGRTVIVTAPGKAITRIEHDPLGRPVRVTDPHGGITTYTYGPFGGLLTVTDPGGAVTTTERDAFGRVVREVHPDRGESVARFDGFGQAWWSLDAAGREIDIAHDPLGRPELRVDADGTTRWRWDTAAHGIGQLAEMESPDGHRTTYSYDALARPSGMTLHLDGETFTTGVSYDAHGRVETISYPQAVSGPFAVRREYDDYGHLIAVRDAATSAPHWQLTAADIAGRITGESFGGGVTTTTRTYDAARSRVTGIFTSSGATQVQSLSYTYDDRLNVRSRSDALIGKTERFEYDRLDRLTCARTDLQNTVCLDPIVYAPNGNLLYKPGVGPFTYDPAQPHAVKTAGVAAYGHDEVGNQRFRPGATLDYTAFDLPKTITLDQGGTVTLDYDAAQSRIRKTSLDEQTVYVGGLYERVTSLTTGEEEHRYYVHGPERAVAVVTRKVGSAPTTKYLHVDALGSVEVLTNAGGGIDEQRSYDAFGARRHPSWSAQAPPPGPLESRLGFTGHEADEELGLVNMRGRLYDPKIGRFLTTDPVVSHPHFGQSWNPYSYVMNNPLAYVDPSGFSEEERDPRPPGAYPEYDAAGNLVGITIVGERPPPPTPPPPPKSGDKDEAAKDPRKAAVDTGGSPLAQDFNLWGHNAGWQPQPSAVAQEIRSGLESAADLALGIAEGLGEVLVGTAKFAVLNAVTLFGYGTYSLGKSLWDGYKEGGILGAIDAVNPASRIIEGSAATYQAAKGGDYRAAGARGAVTAVATVGLVAAVVGAGGAAAGAGRGAATAGARGGASTSAGAVLRPYSGPGGGHHVPAKGAFTGAAGYDPNAAVAIPNAELARLGVSHSAVTGAQMTGYRAFARTGATLTWESVSTIETNALVRGGMTPEMARSTVSQAIEALQSAGVAGPTRIPWGG